MTVCRGVFAGRILTYAHIRYVQDEDFFAFPQKVQLRRRTHSGYLVALGFSVVDICAHVFFGGVRRFVSGQTS